MAEQAKDNIDENDLIIFGACLFCNDACYLKMPDCVGCSGEGQCLCCHDAFCLKPGAPNYGFGLDTEPNGGGMDGTNVCTLNLFCWQCGFNKPSVLCLGQNHMCCYVGSAAFPSTPEIPMTCACCFFSCFPASGCAKTLGEARSASSS